MTTVTAGSTGTYTFNAGESVTVTLDPAEQAQVSILTSAGVQKSGTVVTSTRTIGPFAAGDVMTITAQRGAVDYTITYTGSGSVPAGLLASQVVAGATGVPGMRANGTVLGGISVPNKIMLVGDSVANHNYFESYSGGNTWYSRSLLRYLHAVDGLLGGRLNIVNNGGVSGQRTDEMLARWGGQNDAKVYGIGFLNGIGGAASGPYQNPLPNVAPFAPDLIGIIAGLNDMLQGKGKAATIAGIISLWQRGIVDGAKVFGATLPMSSSADSTWVDLNKSIRDAAKDYGVVMGIPFYEVMFDPTFAGYRNRTGYTQDEGSARLHPNNVASWLAALQGARIISPYTTAYNPLPVGLQDYIGNNASSNQILSNPLMQTTTAASGQSDVTGNWCSGCSASTNSNGGTTRAFSLAAATDSDGNSYGNWLQMKVVTTAAETVADVQFANMIANYVPGASYQIVGRVRLTKGDGTTPLDGTENCLGVSLGMRIGFTGSLNWWCEGHGMPTANLPNQPMIGQTEMVIKSPIVAPDVAAAALGLSALGAPTIFRGRLFVNTSGATGAGGVMAQVSQVAVNRVA